MSEISILGIGKWEEAEQLFRRKTAFFEEGSKRRGLFGKVGYKRYPSPDGRFNLVMERKTEIRWGDAYYSAFLECGSGLEVKVIRSFDRREFSCEYASTPWASSSDKVCLMQRGSLGNDGDDMALILCNEDGREKELARGGWLSFLGWSRGANYILYRTSKDSVVSLNLFDLAKQRESSIVRVTNQDVRQFAFFGNGEENLIILDQSGSLPVLKLLKLQNRELVCSMELDSSILDQFRVSRPGFEEIAHWRGRDGTSWTTKNDNFWDQAAYDDSTKTLYTGILRASSWHEKDYYKRMEWLKVQLD